MATCLLAASNGNGPIAKRGQSPHMYVPRPPLSPTITCTAPHLHRPRSLGHPIAERGTCRPADKDAMDMRRKWTLACCRMLGQRALRCGIMVQKPCNAPCTSSQNWLCSQPLGLDAVRHRSRCPLLGPGERRSFSMAWPLQMHHIAPQECRAECNQKAIAPSVATAATLSMRGARGPLHVATLHGVSPVWLQTAQ